MSASIDGVQKTMGFQEEELLKVMSYLTWVVENEFGSSRGGASVINQRAI